MATLSDWLDDFDFARDLIDPLFDNGWFHYLFPFLLVYAILITILNQIPMFKDRKPVKVIIAVVVGLFAIAFPITDGSCSSPYGGSYVAGGCTLGDLMMVLFPGVTAFSLAILCLYIVAAMMGFDLMDFFGYYRDNNIVKYILGALGVIVVAYYYAKGFGWDGWEGSAIEEFFEDPLLYILIVGGLVFWFITKEDEDPQIARLKREERERIRLERRDAEIEHAARRRGGL